MLLLVLWPVANVMISALLAPIVTICVLKWFQTPLSTQNCSFLFKGWLESGDSKFGKTQVPQFHSHSLTRLVLFSGSVVAQCVKVEKP